MQRPPAAALQMRTHSQEPAQGRRRSSTRPRAKQGGGAARNALMKDRFTVSRGSRGRVLLMTHHLVDHPCRLVLLTHDPICPPIAGRERPPLVGPMTAAADGGMSLRSSSRRAAEASALSLCGSARISKGGLESKDLGDLPSQGIRPARTGTAVRLSAGGRMAPPPPSGTSRAYLQRLVVTPDQDQPGSVRQARSAPLGSSVAEGAPLRACR